MGDARAVAIAKYNQIQDSDPIPEETKHAVRRLVSSNVVGETHEDQVADARELMMMLGIHSSQDDDTIYRVGVKPLPTSPTSLPIR